MLQQTRSADVLPFADVIRRLTFAPLLGVAVIAAAALRKGAVLDLLVLIPLTALFCYFAAMVCVIPIMAISVSLRRPGRLVAATWGILTAWCAAAALFGVREFVRVEQLLGYGVAGCACGLFYAHLVRRCAQEDDLAIQ